MTDDPAPRIDFYAAVQVREELDRRTKEAGAELLRLVLTMADGELPEVLKEARRKVLEA